MLLSQVFSVGLLQRGDGLPLGTIMVSLLGHTLLVLLSLVSLLIVYLVHKYVC